MSGYGYGGGWAPYVSVAERRKQAEREVKRLRREGKIIAPVTIEGRQIATTFWGKAWCKNLEFYRDYENRLARGRSCVRHGLMLDLQVDQGKVTALVSGSSTYRVTITIAEIPEGKWINICTDCSTGIDSLVELLQGRFSKSIMERLCRQDAGLFPMPTEIHFSCSCPDHATMCKHVAGALYGVGARLNHEPELLFQLRGVNADDLIAQVDTSTPYSNINVDADRVLAGNDLSVLFGLDIIEKPDPTLEPPRRQRKPKSPKVKKPSSAPKSKRLKAQDYPDPALHTLEVRVFVLPLAPGELGVVVTGGGTSRDHRTTTLAFNHPENLEATLLQAREFVEHAIGDLFSQRWERWFSSSYGWRFSEVGFDPEEGLLLQASIPTDSPDKDIGKPRRQARTNVRLRNKSSGARKTKT